MNDPTTSIRLIESGDAGALAAHLTRDAQALARWHPGHPADYDTPAGQRSGIAAVRARHAHGEVWPAVVLAGDVVIGRVAARTCCCARGARLNSATGSPPPTRARATPAG